MMDGHHFNKKRSCRRETARRSVRCYSTLALPIYARVVGLHPDLCRLGAIFSLIVCAYLYSLLTASLDKATISLGALWSFCPLDVSHTHWTFRPLRWTFRSL